MTCVPLLIEMEFHFRYVIRYFHKFSSIETPEIMFLKPVIVQDTQYSIKKKSIK